MKSKELFLVCKNIYDNNDNKTLIFLEDLFRVIFTGEFDKELINNELKAYFGEESDVHESFIALFEFDFDEDGNLIYSSNLKKEMLELAVSLSIHFSFEYYYNHFFNYERDHLKLRIQNGVMYFCGFQYLGENQLFSENINKFILDNYKDYRIDSVIFLHRVIDALEEQVLYVKDSKELVYFKIFSIY